MNIRRASRSTLSVILAAVLVLVGCQAVEEPPVVRWICQANDDREPAAMIVAASDTSATISARQKLRKVNLILPRVRSANGVKYATDRLIFWSRGNQAMMSIDDREFKCSVE